MGSEAAPAVDTGQVPTQLAILVPTFDPSIDNVEIWSSKVELLLATWPPQRITELATRLILGCKGTAYQKLQLHRSELLVNDAKGIRKLVELVGGTWGQIPIEKKYEIVEKAIFRNQQKPDETSDSYISRSDVIWTELEAKGIGLAEIRSYILLRGSRLNSDDKKRVLVESGAESSGALKLPKVTSAIRMLGSGFFQEPTGAKKQKGLKTYDHTAFTVEEGSDHEETYWTFDDTVDDNVLESLASEDDEDAALVLQFEDAVAEVVQNDGELCALYSSYQDARKRLSEKVRFRGFWKVRGSEKGKSKGYKGSKGKGKQSLANRIASSYCRVCLKKGHWKNECPQLRDRNSQLSSSSTTSAAPTSFVEVNEPSLTVIHDDNLTDIMMAEDSSGRVLGKGINLVGDQYNHNNDKPWPAREKLRRLINQKFHHLKATINVRIPPISEGKSVETLTVKPVHPQHLISQDDNPIAETLFASTGTIGVVDIGASQTVMGDKQVPELMSQLPKSIRSQVRQVKCNLVFRFGNHQTLVSKRALLMPLGKVSFRIAIVPGATPFLLSNSFLKGIKAVIDTDRETLWSKLLQRNLVINRTAKNLFLMDINQLWEEESSEGQQDDAAEYKPQCFVSDTLPKQGSTPIVHHDIKNFHSEEPKQVVKDSDEKIKDSPKSDDHLSFQASREPLSDQCDHQAICGSRALSTGTHVQLPGEAHVDLRAPHAVSQGERDSDHGREDQRDQRNESLRAREDEDRVWDGQERNAVCTGVSRPRLHRLVCEDLRMERQAVPCEVHHVCRKEAEPGSEGGSHEAQKDRQCHRGEAQRQEVSSECINRAIMGDAVGVRRRRSLPDDVQPKQSGGTDGLHGTGEPTASPTDGVHGDGHSRAREPHERDGSKDRIPVSRPESTESEVETPDTDYIFHTIDQKSNDYRSQIQKLVRCFRQEFAKVESMCSRRVAVPQAGLFEVMCHSQSELTHQANQLGFKAIRFCLESGDLSTERGRANLFQKIWILRPKHLWYSPECRFWCLWSLLNSQKSLELFEKIMTSRWENLWQIALGIVLFEIQTSQSRHFHMEQPFGSTMLKTPGTQTLTDNTHRCCFDMCKMGDLRDPQSKAFIRKRMMVLTTSAELYRGLHGKLCSSHHEHKQIAGNTMVNGVSVPLSKFTEMYPRKFARQVVKYLQNDHSKSNLVLAAENEHPTKRRRLGTKLSPAAIEQCFPDVNWQTVMTQVDRIAPRVGTMVIDKGNLIELISKMCPAHEVKHIVLCRGMDRYVGPNCSIPKGSAPLRRMISFQRRTNELYVDEEWEPWEHLSYRGLRRKCVSSRIGLTIFATTKMPTNLGSMSPSAHVSIPIREGPGDTEGPQNKKARIDLPDPSEGVGESVDLPTEVPLSKPKESINWTSQKHGPNFLKLTSEEQSWLIKIHRNLGHPGSQKLQNFCRQLNCPNHILQAIPDMKCSTCTELRPPSISRSAAIHEPMDFGSVVSMDGVTWHNKQGERFHFYHFVDQATVFQTAVIAPSRTTDQAAKALISGWMLWAGSPHTLIVDAASELNSEEFLGILQRHGVRCRTCAADAHWQNARAERHGGILQVILNKMDAEEPISDYDKLATALQHATQTKNQWSRHRGYAPEMLVFGKSVHIPGSIVSDSNQATHAMALSQLPDGVRFRTDLATRERARRAFAAVDNDQVLRRAMVSRSRPNRGVYDKGEWVMYWKKRGEADGNWIGPAQVLAQEADRVVWISHGTKLFRIAPEHVRYLSAAEEWNHRVDSSVAHNSAGQSQGGEQFQDLHNSSNHGVTSQEPTDHNTAMPVVEPLIGPQSEVAAPPQPFDDNVPPTIEHTSSTPSEQPDQEPDVPGVTPEATLSQPSDPSGLAMPEDIPVPDSDEELLLKWNPASLSRRTASGQ